MRARVSPICRRLVDFYLERLQQDKPDAKLPTGDALDSWYYYMDLMLRADGREVNTIGNVISWVTQDDFEKSNVRCPRKLRERFDQLEIKWRAWEAKQQRLEDREEAEPPVVSQPKMYEPPVIDPHMTPEERERSKQLSLAKLVTLMAESNPKRQDLIKRLEIYFGAYEAIPYLSVEPSSADNALFS
jgi:hypothetical protein